MTEHHAHTHFHGRAEKPVAQGQAKDPVCGMSVDLHTTKHRHTHSGAPYHFCSAGCQLKFVADPAKYLSAAKEDVTVPAGTVYTCPMHLEIRRDGPGSCPICGMALEHLLVEKADGPSAELVDMTLRFWLGLAFTVPVFARSSSVERGAVGRVAVWSNVIHPNRDHVAAPELAAGLQPGRRIGRRISARSD